MSAKKKVPKKSAAELKEPQASYAVRSSFRSVGNSKGVIISSKLIEASGIAGNELIIEAAKGIIAIREVKKTDVNTDLSSWDKQFKLAIKNGAKSESNLFEGLKNDFDEKEW
jgi:antitoxin component of MazEF toxin-antitoxin module